MTLCRGSCKTSPETAKYSESILKISQFLANQHFAKCWAQREETPLLGKFE